MRNMIPDPLCKSFEAGGNHYLIPPFGSIVKLNSSGLLIWQWLGQRLSWDEICAAYAEKTGIDIAESTAEVTAFTQQMYSSKCLTNELSAS
ncbi:PqqD family protein [Caenimonas koreensis]|nr:PqqD family protein [Caenimonas koreensis]